MKHIIYSYIQNQKTELNNIIKTKLSKILESEELQKYPGVTIEAEIKAFISNFPYQSIITIDNRTRTKKSFILKMDVYIPCLEIILQYDIYNQVMKLTKLYGLTQKHLKILKSNIGEKINLNLYTIPIPGDSELEFFLEPDILSLKMDMHCVRKQDIKNFSIKLRNIKTK